MSAGLPSFSDYDPTEDIWPDRNKGRPFVPVRVGIDPRTFRMVVGWPHVEMSIWRLFATRFHSRPMRRYVGSFVPHLIGQNATPTPITRFWWAMASAIDLWEPCYTVRRVILRSDRGVELSIDDGSLLTSAEDLRAGCIKFETVGAYMPRGHLGDRTLEGQRTLSIQGYGNNKWTVETV